MITDAEFERRKPVWTAFSEFWLDTELEDSGLRSIARIAAASGYSVAELRDIYLYEVAPVVSKEARKRAEHRSIWLRFWIFVRIGRWLMTDVTDSKWHRMISLIPTENDSKPFPETG